MNSKVDIFLSKAQKWKEEMEQLRMICLDCGLTEELKWGIPVYTFQIKNIVGINGFKEYVALAFFKGALLYDDKGVLIQPGTVQAGQYIRFTNVQEIIKMEQIIKEYIYEAIEVEKAGLEVDNKNNTELIIPTEFQNKLNKFPALKTAFESLTMGRQRAYILYFSDAKLSKTREARIEKCMELILKGKGLNDDYELTKNITSS
jgi:uncharacterized protein YdeI (YjbR/CyaY-like superfamily)